jgi:hypothetical protein
MAGRFGGRSARDVRVLRSPADFTYGSPSMSGEPEMEIDWAGVFANAMAIAVTTWPELRARETVTEGIGAVALGDAPWDPRGKLSLERHVIAVGFNILRNQRRAATRRRRADFVAELSAAEQAREAAPPDVALEEIERKERLYRRLCDACEGAPDALAVLAAEREGILGGEAQMKHCHLTEQAWTIARKHIGRKLQAILEDEKRKEEEEDA